MTKGKLWLLLKVQMHEALLGSRGTGSREKQTSARGHRTLGRSRSGTGEGRRSGLTGLIVTVAVMLLLACMMFGGLGIGMHEIGMDRLTLLIGMVGASLFSLITTVYQVNGLLFGYKDFEMTMAMPFPAGTIVACRVLILYAWNLLYCAVIMIPAGIAYAIFASPPAVFWLIYIVAVLLTPLIPSIIASIIGTLIALAASRFERRGTVGMILTVVFMILYMLFVMNLSTIMDSMAQIAPQIMETLVSVWPPASWVVNACCDLNMLDFALFVGVSLGGFALFCWAVGKVFVPINSALSTSHTKAHFKLKVQKAETPRRALLRKEMKRMFGSSAYLMNACIGSILAIFFSVLIVIVGPQNVFSSMAGEEEAAAEITGFFAQRIGIILVSFLTMMLMIGCLSTASSVSLEGQNLWIVKTMPVSAWDILRSKQNLNLIVAGVTSAVIGVCLCIAVPTSLLNGILYFLLPLSAGLYMTMQGQVFDLNYGRLDWTSEVKVLKQSKPVMLATFTGLGIGLATFILSMPFGAVVPIIASAAMLIASWLLFRRLRTRGVAQFDGLFYD